MKDILNKLEEFIKQAQQAKFGQRSWLYSRDLEIYVRKGFHLIENRMETCFDIANITVYKPGFGTFTKLVADLLPLIPWPILYIESVQEARFCRYLERNHWLPSITPYCYYLKK